ncbi:MAG: phasin family protein [Sphingomonas bacterium]|nr:phasin family protein [Sphingomonas bacterium]MDB5684859.1 phasin family protein [Sphingomonas bacterium]
MVMKRGKKTPQVPFADGGEAVAEAVRKPVTLPAAIDAPATSAVAFTTGTATFPSAADAPAADAGADAETPAAFFEAAPADEFEAAPVAAAKPAETDAVDADPAPAPADVTPAAVVATAETNQFASPSTPSPAPVSSGAPFLKGLFEMATAPEMITFPGAERFQSMFGDVNERAKTAVEKSTKIAEEMAELTKGNVEALVASGRVAAKGAESMTQEVAEYSKKNFESATGALKSFAAVKSPTELFQLQSEFAKSSFDTMVAEASKVSESMLKLMGEIAQPLSTRYAVAAEKMKSAF